MKMVRFPLLIALVLVVAISCVKDAGEKKHTRLFTEIDAESSGLTFNNQIRENKDTNYYKYAYLYNGGGVAIGDINNDDLPDLYFTSTQGMDKLFLNKGDLKFEDISQSAGISNFGGMKSGANMVDINNDGWLDIYVCRHGMIKEELPNLLFINNGDNTFTERAAEYGINDSGYGTHSVFFDIDNDNDLDLYVLNQPGEFKQPLNEMIEKINNPTLDKSDKLYRNDGNGQFTDVTESAGIKNYGYGLGIAVSDLNNDGFLDIYVANDFDPHDCYYVNNGDGSFTESLQTYFNHCSYYSMGCDLADLNHDSYQDLLVVEMLAEDNMRQKTNMASMDINRFYYMVSNDLYYQYMRNSLQINNGNGYFSDIAHYSGIEKTDWSWGSLFGDYDNDGDDDILIVNGYLHDIQDKDFAKRSNRLAKEFDSKLSFEQAFSLLKSTPLTNYAFENTGDLKFQKATTYWGFDNTGFSNGMAYGDLDRDGDLDIVVNNINSNALLYRNNSDNDQFVGFKLKGPKKNLDGLHTKVILDTKEGKRYKEFQVSRGYQSSMDHVVHFGLAADNDVIGATVIWPDGKTQVIESVKKGRYYELDHKNAAPPLSQTEQKESLLTASKKDCTIPFSHSDTYFNDYGREVLIPHQLSQLGPCVAAGDVNNDGLDDLYVGNGKSYLSKLYLQQADCSFIEIDNNSFEADSIYEDVEASFLDIDGDNDLDLIVGSGSNQFEKKNARYRDRVYLNDGNGGFSKAKGILPDLFTSTGDINYCDYDEDGDLDLFIGTRLSPGEYPRSDKSYLLINKNGTYSDRTDELAPELSTAGMVTSSVWTDIDMDGDKDLVLVGEWSDLQFFMNDDGKLKLVSNESFGLDKNLGWWNCVVAKDIDKDGDEDLIIGNLGLNYKYNASDDHPFEIYSGDFDDNGQLDILLGYYSDEVLYPVRGFQCSSEQMPVLKKEIHSYEEFGKSSLFDIYGDRLNDALNIKANEFGHLVLWNEQGQFKKEYLPYPTQWAPIMDIEFYDFNKDGYDDLVIAGNWFVSEVETPRADAGVGRVLIFDPDKRGFLALSVQESGLFANKDVRQVSILEGNERPVLVIANNKGPLQSYVINK